LLARAYHTSARVTHSSGQTNLFDMLLDVQSRPFSLGTMRVVGSGAVCCW